MIDEQYEFYEFFAGGGMARLGLGGRWRCTMANDNSEKRARAYRPNSPPAEKYLETDVERLTLGPAPRRATTRERSRVQ